MILGFLRAFWMLHKSFQKFVKAGILSCLTWIVTDAVHFFPQEQEFVLVLAVTTACLNYLKHNWR